MRREGGDRLLLVVVHRVVTGVWCVYVLSVLRDVTVFFVAVDYCLLHSRERLCVRTHADLRACARANGMIVPVRMSYKRTCTSCTSCTMVYVRTYVRTTRVRTVLP